MTDPRICVARHDGRIVVSITPEGGEPQAWALEPETARTLRDALTLALGQDSGPVRLSCGGCGVPSGSAHAVGCPYAFADRRKLYGALAVVPGIESQSFPGVPPARRYLNAATGASHEVPVGSCPLCNLEPPVGPGGCILAECPSGNDAARAAIDAWLEPPTPEEKAAGERLTFRAPEAKAHSQSFEIGVKDGQVEVSPRVNSYPPADCRPAEWRAGAPVKVACDECFMFPPAHLGGCSKR